MNTITPIRPDQVPSVLQNLWVSPEIKRLSVAHPFFSALSARLAEAPLFFFEMDDPTRERHHLTSFFRLIARRSYSNPIIQDLYYLHELGHAAEYRPNADLDYPAWSAKLSQNELFASLLTEVFVYMFDPDLATKTFSPLWATRFLPGRAFTTDPAPDAWFDVSGDRWSTDMNAVRRARMTLRAAPQDVAADPAEALIVSYNIKHEVWLTRWRPHHRTIDQALTNLRNGSLSATAFIGLVESAMDAHRRPFYPSAKQCEERAQKEPLRF